MKQLLINVAALAFPNFDQEFILETEASGVGLTIILAPKQHDGTVRPIAYVSRGYIMNWKLWSLVSSDTLSSLSL